MGFRRNLIPQMCRLQLHPKYLTYCQVTTTSMRSKLGALWSDDLTGRHVTASVKSKPYRGVENVFSIADDEDEDDIVSTFTFTFTFILRSFFLQIFIFLHHSYCYFVTLVIKLILITIC